MAATYSGIAVLVILICGPSLVICSNSLTPETLWVAPTQNSSFCENKTEPCKTLTQYKAANMLNRSNVNWKFISGPTPHLLTGGLYVFDRVANVSLLCEKDGNCFLNCTGHSDLAPSTYQMCTFVFNQAKNVSIRGLIVSYQVNKIQPPLNPAEGILKYLDETVVYGKCRASTSNLTVSTCVKTIASVSRTWVFVDSTNIFVVKMTFSGPQNSWFVLRPKGNFSVKSSTFCSLSSGIPQYDPLGTSNHQSHVVIMLRTPKESLVKLQAINIIFEDTRFEGQRYLPWNCTISGTNASILLSADETMRGQPVNFTISSCKFFACPVINLYVFEDPNFHIAVTHTQIDGNVTKSTAHTWLRKCNMYYRASAIECQLYQPRLHSPYCSSSKHHQGLFLVSNTNFSGLASEKASAILLNLVILTYMSHSMQVVIQNNTFTNNHGIYQRNLFYIRHDVFIDESESHNMTYEITKFKKKIPINYPVRIESNSFTHNFIESKIDYFCDILTRIHHKFIVVNADVHDNGQSYKYKFICYRFGAVYLSGFQGMYRVQYIDNVIQNNRVSALTLFQSQVEMRGHNVVRYNLGYYGGGIRTTGNSALLFTNDSFLEVSWNQAYFSGGGFYIMDECTLNIRRTNCPCFFQFINDDGSYVEHLPMSSLKPHVLLDHNKAFRTGKGSASDIFNSNIDSCVLKTNIIGAANNTIVFKKVFNFSKPRHLQFSSIPRRICLSCSEKSSLCQPGNATGPLKYYHGQHLHISVKLEGDMNIPMSGVLYVDIVNSNFVDSESDVFPPELHSTHVLLDQCNKLTIPPLPAIPKFYHNASFTLQLRVELFAGTSVLNEGRFLYTTIQTQLMDGCPSGFLEDNSTELRYLDCKCNTLLLEPNITCDLDTESLTKPSDKMYWVGKQGKDVLWSSMCLYHLCNASADKVFINNMDAQCLYNRTGVLCGQCPPGYSVQILTTQCGKCNDWYLFLLPLFFIGGPLSLVITGFLNLTISVGAVNGFMYYVAVIAIVKDAFLGFNSVCLYDGMGDFEITLLSFLFPVYLLLLVGIVCCLPRCRCIKMHKINRKIGPRITPVLATLVTIAYLFMSEATIKVLLFSRLYSTDGTGSLVWAFDGSLEYFKSTNHIILGTTALTSLVFFLFPAAMVATFGDVLRRCIKGRYYMNFLDTFHAAFRFGFGFWFGVRLLILTFLMCMRLVLCSNAMHLLVVYTSTLIIVFQMCTKPYRGVRIERCTTQAMRNRYCHGNMNRSIPNALDNLYQLNLVAVFGTALFLEGNKIANEKADKMFSVSYALAGLQLLFIIAYHLLEFTPFGEWVIEKFSVMRSRFRRWREDRRSRSHEVLLEPENPEDVGDLELRLDDCHWDSDESSGDSNTKEDREGNIAPTYPSQQPQHESCCNKRNPMVVNEALSTHGVSPLLAD